MFSFFILSFVSSHLIISTYGETCFSDNKEMQFVRMAKAKKTFPTSNPNFSVMQSFPAGIPPEDSDPFLMCDQYDYESLGPLAIDEYSADWHPHRGMDIMSYLVSGVGRHADSLGNRGTFASPGMQWMSVGSGIEHAEGGGTPLGEQVTGFQIWINVPSDRKMDDPIYGIEPPENIPVISHLYPQIKQETDVMARLLAGAVGSVVGPFTTKTSVQMIDFVLSPGAVVSHAIPHDLDNCMLFVWRGSGVIGNTSVPTHYVIQVDAMFADVGSRDCVGRGLKLQAGPEGMSAMLFAGKRLNQPVKWKGPFVMHTDRALDKAISDYRQGRLLKKRVSWNYRQAASFPSMPSASTYGTGTTVGTDL